MELNVLVFAEDEIEACDIAKSQVDEEPHVSAVLVDPDAPSVRFALPIGWNEDCLVYHGGEKDITVSEVINKITEEAETTKAISKLAKEVAAQANPPLQRGSS